MTPIYNFLDTSYLAGILLIVFFGIVLLLLWIGRRNIVDYPDNVDDKASKDTDIYRKAEFKDRSDVTEDDRSFLSNLN